MSTDNPEDAFNICETRRRILDEDGHKLVVGGPGSGKTTIALLKARRYALQNLGTEQNVLFLSFSNSAIRRIMEDKESILTDEVADLIKIKTYHSFAWEILKSHGYLTSSRRRLKIISAQDAAVRSAGLTDQDWLTEQNRLYVEEGLVVYDQFAIRATELLRRSSTVRSCFCTAYPLILVDEFQDTDEDQWALVQMLSKQSEIIALGDLEQRIYEWRPGVSESRIDDFSNVLECERFDFANENNRSPATGIAGFARSLLSPGFEQILPKEVVLRKYNPYNLPVQLHFSVRLAYREAKKHSVKNHPRVAIAARSKTLVRKISNTLLTTTNANGRILNPVRHDVLIDQYQILLSARVIANILSSTEFERSKRLAEALDRIADMLRSAANKTNINASDKLYKWAEKCRDGNPPSTKCVAALENVMDWFDKEGFTGSPTRDWLSVRRSIEGTNIQELNKVADYVRYLRLLGRGSAIEQALIDLWISQGNYTGAEVVLEQSILQDQIVDKQRESAVFSVLNMHQLKGREYDSVVLVEDKYNTFMARDKKPPYADTRRLLHVSLTRARHYVVILSSNGNVTLDRLISSNS